MAAANRHGKKTFLSYDKLYLCTKTQYVTIMCSAISHDRISLEYSKIENMHILYVEAPIQAWNAAYMLGVGIR